MAQVRRSATSRRDLIEISKYVAERNPAAATRLLDTIDVKLELLAQHPELGEIRSDLGRDLRSFSTGSYVIVYRPMKEGIELVRVIHASRDISSLP